MADGSPALSADLRPLTTSELIDRGFILYRQNFAGLFLLALLSQIAPLATSQALFSATQVLPAQGGLMERPVTDPSRAGVLLGVWILSQILAFGFGVVMTIYLSDAYLGSVPYLKKAFGLSRGRLTAAVTTSLLNMVLLGLTLIFPMAALVAFFTWLKLNPPLEFSGLLFLMVGGAFLFVLSLAPALIVFMRLMLTIPAVALENLSGWRAAKRSSVLVRYDPGLGFLYWGEMRLSFLLLPLFVIELLALALTSLPAMIHEANDAMVHGSIGQFSAPPEPVVILSQILVLLSGSLLLPLYLIATTLFYYDVRIRREGLDLELMAAQVRAEAA